VLTLPQPRGEISARLLEALAGPVTSLAPFAPDSSPNPLDDEDLQLALYLSYELHYRGLPGVRDGWEWEPSLLALRRFLESQFEDALFAEIGPVSTGVPARDFDIALREIANADDGPSLSRYMEREATREEFLEFVIHRSAYQLKEADPHSWVLPRLHGAPKAALVEIQADEYGGGRAERIHAQLFADAMEALDLDARYGAYVDAIPARTLATVNLMSLFGLHRAWRGAIVGHLALFEMTSSIPNRRYGNGLRRLGYNGAATVFFDEHVEADAVHENIAAVDLAGGLARQEPGLAGDILWGARALAALDRRWASAVLGAWQRDRSSLLRQVESSPDRAPAPQDAPGPPARTAHEI
jgi:hypothetical protein